MKTEKLQIAREGRVIGEFTRAELDLIFSHNSGGILLTDHVFIPEVQKWVRLSDVLTQHKTLAKNGIYLWIIIVGVAIVLWNFGGPKGLLDALKILCGF